MKNDGGREFEVQGYQAKPSEGKRRGPPSGGSNVVRPSDNGGPAFPTQPTTIFLADRPVNQSEVKALAERIAERQPLGMSRRDWFVGQAINGLLPAIAQKAAVMGDWKGDWTKETVDVAEAIADEHLRREERDAST